MTDRQRILAAIRGDVPDRLPWVPRLEFWRRARSRNGTLPREARGRSLMEIAGLLGAGYYHVIPDFTKNRDELDMIDYGIGIFRHPVLPFEPELEGMDRKVLRRRRETVIEYRTPVGSIRTETVFTDEMLDAGASVPWRAVHAISEPKDFEVAGYVFSRVKVRPRVEGYLARRAEVGERGLVIGYTSGSACPMHHIMRELMPLEQFFYAMHDYPEKIERLAAQMEPYYAQIKQIAAESPAEVILLGGNYDDSITYPPFFAKHILPALRDYAALLHRRGKYLLTHTDGENRRLLPLYREAGFDIADSVCPYPMTQCRLEDLRQAFADRIAIWGGIPSVLLCPDSATDEQFQAFVDDLVTRYHGQSRLILGVSDMVPADSDWDRLRRASDKIAEAG